MFAEDTEGTGDGEDDVDIDNDDDEVFDVVFDDADGIALYGLNFPRPCCDDADVAFAFAFALGLMMAVDVVYE
jgi:hypothetical protein